MMGGRQPISSQAAKARLDAGGERRLARLDGEGAAAMKRQAAGVDGKLISQAWSSWTSKAWTAMMAWRKVWQAANARSCRRVLPCATA